MAKILVKIKLIIINLEMEPTGKTTHSPKYESGWHAHLPWLVWRLIKRGLWDFVQIN